MLLALFGGLTTDGRPNLDGGGGPAQPFATAVPRISVQFVAENAGKRTEIAASSTL